MNKCQFCLCSQKLISQRIDEKYYEAFNFYFARPINELIQSSPQVAHVITFKDLLIFNSDDELLKRFYKAEEVHSRIDILTEFYTQNYESISPNLLPLDSYQIMNKRRNKLQKLAMSKLSPNEFSGKNSIHLEHKILNSKLTMHSCISFETQQHNIYSQHSHDLSKLDLDLRGLAVIENMKQMNLSQIEKQNSAFEIEFDNIAKEINKPQKTSLPKQYYKSAFVKDKNIKPRQNEKIQTYGNQLNLQSESKHSQSSGRNQQEQQIDFEKKRPLVSRVHSDTSSIQRMLREFQTQRDPNIQSLQTTNRESKQSSTDLPLSHILFQGYQGSQKSISKNHDLEINQSDRNELLKKVYQTNRKPTQNQEEIDRLMQLGSMTERTHSSQQEHARQKLLEKVADLQIKKYLIPSQYNAGLKKDQKSAKSTQSKNLRQKNQTFQNKQHISSTDDIMKKYIQIASETLGQSNKKFDFKLNLETINQNPMRMEDVELLNRKNFLSERNTHKLKLSDQFNSHRKMVQK